MKLLLCLFIFISALTHAYEIETLPVNHLGRFRPFGVLQMQWDEELKMLPSKQDPSVWLPLKKLKENIPNPTLFTDQEWTELKKTFLTEDFANTYFLAYQPLTEKKFSLSKAASLTFPTIRQLQTELWFYRWPLINYAIIGYLGALLFFLLAEGFQTQKFKTLGWICLSSAFFLHTLILAARSFILMRPPVSNMGETVIYVPWITVLVSYILSKRLHSYLPLIASSGIACCLLTILQWTFTAYPLETVQAVLNSQIWLTIHVLMIVGSYGALILGGILGHIFLIQLALRCNPSSKLQEALLQSLYVGVALLIPGTILGGVWAAQSWGRFWDWDPKESWAFISACVYLLVIHAYRFGKIQAKGLAVGSIGGLLAISFTWYGVNYILGTGLHSYGFGSGGEWMYFTYVIFEILFIIFFTKSIVDKKTIKKL